MAALLNGVRRPLPVDASRPTRGTLALEVLTSGRVPDDEALAGYDGFHLVLATLAQVDVWSWNGEELDHQQLTGGNHIVVNLGVDASDDPLVPHFEPLLRALPDPLLAEAAPTLLAWEPWTDLLAGEGLDPADPRALLVHRELDGRTYASTSATLVGLSPDGIRYDFSGTPTDPDAWYQVTSTEPAVRR
jgi:hypothetical protein